QDQHFANGKKYEFASLAFGEVYQLAAALAYLERVGLARIEAQTSTLVAMLRRGLTERGFRVFTPAETRSPILSFYIGGAAEAAAKALDGAGVQVSVAEHERTDDHGGPRPPATP